MFLQLSYFLTTSSRYHVKCLSLKGWKTVDARLSIAALCCLVDLPSSQPKCDCHRVQTGPPVHSTMSCPQYPADTEPKASPIARYSSVASHLYFCLASLQVLESVRN